MLLINVICFRCIHNTNGTNWNVHQLSEHVFVKTSVRTNLVIAVQKHGTQYGAKGLGICENSLILITHIFNLTLGYSFSLFGELSAILFQSFWLAGWSLGLFISQEFQWRADFKVLYCSGKHNYWIAVHIAQADVVAGGIKCASSTIVHCWFCS